MDGEEDRESDDLLYMADDVKTIIEREEELDGEEDRELTEWDMNEFLDDVLLTMGDDEKTIIEREEELDDGDFLGSVYEGFTGYMSPLQGVVSMDGVGNNVSSAAIQPPHDLPLPFSNPRPKRCLTHWYIAGNIHYHQLLTRYFYEEGAKLEEDEDIDKAIAEQELEFDDDDGGGGYLGPIMVPVPSVILPNNGKFRHSIQSWQKGVFLGSGSFGTVYEGYTENGLFFAVKEVSLLDQGSHGQQSINQLEQEISLLSQFKHENIVQYLGTAKDEAKLYIFLELVTKGSLAKLYQTYTLGDSQVSSYTRQILNGLKYLHERNVVHRDIKCANILVDASGSVKLADFGLAKVTYLNDIKSCKGTAFWMAPEVVHHEKNGYGLAADIWSLGCTVLEMLTRQIPYSHLEAVQALFRIGKGELPPVPDSLSRDARDFIYKCLQVNPDNRPTAAQLLEHLFVKRSLQANPSPASPHYYANQLDYMMDHL